MSQQKQTENTDYQFIREKVVSKKKGRLRRGVLYTGFVILLAILFGVVARAAFWTSNEPLKKFFGVNDLTPTPTPKPTPTAVPTPKPTPTPEPTLPGEPTPTDEAPITITPEPTLAGNTATASPEETALEEYLLAFSRIREVVKEAQKSILTVHVINNGTDWLDDPYDTESLTNGILMEKTEDSLMVLVNLDRVQSASRITVEYDGKQYEAKLWGYDKEYNLAVIRIDAKDISYEVAEEMTTAVLGDSSKLLIGTPVVILGNPNGYIGSMEFGTVTHRGSIYYLTDNSIELFYTDTSCNPDGDGVVVNLKGEIIGVITRTMKNKRNENLCTSMGITQLRERVARMISAEELCYFGVRGEDIPASVLAEQGLENGIYVTEVLPDSPAFESGLKTGDIILSFDENKVFSYSDFYAMLDAHTVGDEICVTIQRTIRMKSEQMEFQVVLTGR